MQEIKIISVGFGKYEISRDSEVVLVTFGLGSCVAVSFYDPVEKLGGVVHLALPESNKKDVEPAPSKYVNTGIPLLLNEMIKQRADPKKLIIKVVGGAQILKLNYALTSLEIGDRNVKAVKEALRSLGLRISAEETGGDKGRSYKLFIANGKSLIKTANSEHEI